MPPLLASSRDTPDLPPAPISLPALLQCTQQLRALSTPSVLLWHSVLPVCRYIQLKHPFHSPNPPGSKCTGRCGSVGAAMVTDSVFNFDRYQGHPTPATCTTYPNCDPLSLITSMTIATA